MADLRLVVLLMMAGLHAVLTQGPPPPVYRLPPTITPIQYNLRLEPNMDYGVVAGTVRIEVEVNDSQNDTLNSIALHYDGKGTVNSALIIDLDGTLILPAFTRDDDNSLLTLVLPGGKTLKDKQSYVIKLQFTSPLNTVPQGLFTGYFYNSSKYIASNFRPTFAREAFPCFDEPHFKVPVALQIVRPSSYIALSTGGLGSSVNISDGMVLDTFNNTGPISIHSLGIFISQHSPKKSMKVNVVAPPSLPASVPYLKKLIKNVIQSFGKFPYDELTLVVLPDLTQTSFSSFGFVFTSPEVYLGTVGSALQWTSLQLQLTEELLRQYLEYPKTPRWWSEVWLSESIGAYLALPFQSNQPMLLDWLKIVVRSKALGDYTNPSGPVITSDDLTKWDIENIINNQTIKLKGLSTLLMWKATMPAGVVSNTLTEFQKLQQSVVNTTDLVTLMVKNIKANKTYDVSDAIPLLPNWLTQPSSPSLEFTIIADDSFALDQVSSPLRPISVAIAVGPYPDWRNTLQGRWLLNSSAHFSYTNISSASVINIETAPFRVNYSPDQWDTLTQALSSGWAPSNVAGALQDDALALSLNGSLDFSISLSVLNSTNSTGRANMDWWPVVCAADAISSKLGNSNYGLSAFGKYFADLFSSDLLEQLDLRNSANYSDLSIARELLTPFLCRFNISTCREAVVELGGPLWQGNSSGIAPSDVENVACYGARYTPGALAPLLEAYQNSSTGISSLKRYYTIALSCLTEQESVKSLLYTILNSNSSLSLASDISINKYDAQKILIGLASSMENTETILNFLIDQSSSIQDRFGVSTLSAVIKSLAKYRVDLSQLSSLLNEKDLAPYVIQSVNEAMVKSTSSQSWYSTYSSQLYEALPAGDVPPEPSTTTTTTTSTTTTTTTTKPGPTPEPTTGPSTTSKPAPAAAAALSDFRLFTISLIAIMITLSQTLR